MKLNMLLALLDTARHQALCPEPDVMFLMDHLDIGVVRETALLGDPVDVHITCEERKR